MSFRAVNERAARFLAPHQVDKWYWRLGQKLAFVGTAFYARTVLNNLFKPEVHNLDVLQEAYRMSKIENRGLLTVMNHTSVLDEPLCWGILPVDQIIHPQRMRWTLGAENICFKNRFLSGFFSMGQVLCTRRFGAGPFQGSVDAAVRLLSPDNCEYSPEYFNSAPYLGGLTPTANWVHVFPEALVHQPEAPHNNTLRYFHWGVSRMVLEAAKPPIIVPIFTQGFEKVMPEDQASFVPRNIGSSIQFNVGQPMREEEVVAFRRRWVELIENDGSSLEGDMSENLKTGKEAQALRSEVASALRRCLNENARFKELPPDEPRFDDPDFWRLPAEKRGVRVKKNIEGRHIRSG
ncbi:tafazzin [Trichomonascus vanleenenianus]|uniref:lysophosphatidylcholine acyltransferase n=1 Tax=Trichomonascus vanleenenianus TaxID=2268995 RepID=UPI003ECA3DFF